MINRAINAVKKINHSAVDEMKHEETWSYRVYLVFQCVNNSRVAEHNQHQWQQELIRKEQRRDYLLCGVAAEDAPRYTDSIDDV